MTQKLGDLLNSPQYLGSVCTGQYVLSDGAALPGPYFASQETNAWSIIAQGCKDNFCENIKVGRKIRRIIVNFYQKFTIIFTLIQAERKSRRKYLR